jgi:GNAT superfamily N-acetyltransferase
MVREVRVRAAKVDELGALEDLQRRASLANLEDRDALLAHPDALGLPAEHIGEVLVAELDYRLAGFAVLLQIGDRAELDGLFVEPEYWRQGVGAALVDAVTLEARRRGLSLITVVTDPAATNFYRKCGFSVEGATETRFGPAVTMTR